MQIKTFVNKMTSCGPYTEATIVYEPQTEFGNITATPNSCLDFVMKNYPKIFSMIQKAHLENLYDSNIDEYQITLFLIEPNDAVDAFSFLKSFTIPQRIDPNTLKSSRTYTLKTMNSSWDLVVQNIDNQTYVNGFKVNSFVQCLNGNIFLLQKFENFVSFQNF